MKNKSHSILVVGAILVASLNLTAYAQDAKPATPAAPVAAPAVKPLTVEKSALVTVTAKVEAINQTTREVTLKGPAGHSVTLTVDQGVKRLSEVAVGDDVTADYYVSIAAELRAPTEAEKKEPFVILTDVVRAPAGSAPAGGVLHAFRVVATIVGLDQATQTVSLHGPQGNVLDVRAEKPENFKKLKVGDTIVVVYSEALAISLQKAAPKAPAPAAK
jgi:hypothetical protein